MMKIVKWSRIFTETEVLVLVMVFSIFSAVPIEESSSANFTSTVFPFAVVGIGSERL